MSTAAEKRFYAAKLAAKFHGKGAIREGKTTDNRGQQLESFLNPIGRIWSPGLYWCAAYVSAIAFYTDRDLPGGPQRKFKSAVAVAEAAGVFSKNIEDAFIGLAISWGVKGDGHVGIVVDVDRSRGIVTVSEGNTGSNESGWTRNGYTTTLKTYTLDKSKSRAGMRWIGQPGSKSFNAYSKIWEEDDYSIRGSHTPKPIMIASNDYNQYSSPESSNQTSSSTSTIQNTKQAAQQDYSNLFLFSSGNIMNVGEQQELSKPITQTSNSKKSEGAIPIDKQNISLT